MLLLALPVAAVTTFLAYPLVEILGGREFLPHGAIALQLVIWSIPLGWLNSVTNYVLIALGLERMQPRAFALAVGFNIIANLLFIPRFSYVAASITTILSELVLLLVFAYYLRRRMAGVRWDRLLARPLLVTAVMIAVMWAASQIHLALAVVLGGAVYLGGLWALRIVGDAERRILADILPAPIAARLHLV
jgi:O-antigen/teichoic acid export membrane protein